MYACLLFLHKIRFGCICRAKQENVSGSSRYTFLVRYRWLWFPRTTGANGFAVMVFTLSRLEHGRFRRNSVCCGPVYGPWLRLRFGYGPVHDSRLRLRVGSGPVCTQTFFLPIYDISHAFNFSHAFTASYLLFYDSTSTVSPGVASCANCTSWRHWLRLSYCAAMTALVLLNLR